VPPFGDVLRSVAVPGDASATRGLTCLPHGRIAFADQKASALFVCDVQSLSVVASYAIGASGFQNQAGTAWGDSLIFSQAIAWRPGDGSNVRSLVSGTSPVGVAWDGSRLMALSTNASVQGYAPVDSGPWQAVWSAQANSYAPAFGEFCVAIPYAYIGTNSHGAIISKCHLPTLSVVATCSAPAADLLQGLAHDGARLLVMVGGATDRLYWVTP
jgi:hypothetical protein